MRGTYRIGTPDGVLEFHNVITTAGEISILNAVAGKSAGFASSIMAGIGSTAATINDTALEFAVGGNNINAVITDVVNKKIYFKATLPASDNYTIYELGCFSTNFIGAQSASGAGSLILAAFGENSNWLNDTGVAALGTANNRIGVNSIEYAGVSAAKGHMFLTQDLSSLPDTSTFDLAYYASGLSDLIVRFKVDATNYFACDTWSIANGYHIEKKAKSTFVATGAPNWNSIATLEIEMTGTSATLSLDALRYTVPVVSEAIDSTLLSRVIPTTPIQKLAGISMDVEYLLELS